MSLTILQTTINHAHMGGLWLFSHMGGCFFSDPHPENSWPEEINQAMTYHIPFILDINTQFS